MTAPTAPPVITGDARAPKAAEGCGSGNLDHDPGDCSTLGALTIYIEEPAVDDRTPPEQMAYRVEVIEGEAPFPTDVPIHTVARFDEGPAFIFAHISQAKVSAKVRVIPVDAGGNEGPPSNVIHLGFDESGCSVLGASSVYNLAPTGLILLWLAAQRRRKPLRAVAQR